MKRSSTGLITNEISTNKNIVITAFQMIGKNSEYQTHRVSSPLQKLNNNIFWQKKNFFRKVSLNCIIKYIIHTFNLQIQFLVLILFLLIIMNSCSLM